MSRLAAFCVICACLALGPGAASAAAAGWLEPDDVSGLSQSITDTPQVAMDAAGDAVAIGMRDDGADVLVEAIERPAGGEWSESVPLSDPDEEEPTDTQVAVDAAGNAVAIWSAWVDTDYTILAASRPAGGEWSDPEPLGGLPFIATRLHLAMNASGDAVATWTGFDEGQVIVVAALPAGGEWSEPEEVSAGTEEGRFSQVGIDAEGNAIAVWQQIDPGENVIRAATRPAEGEWSEPETLSADGDNATAPRIAVDAGGDAVAVWSVVDGLDVSVHAKARPADGDWSDQEDVSAEDEVAGEAEVAIDANGAVATWTAPVGDDEIIRGAVRPAGVEEWSAPENVSSPVDDFRSTDLETNGAAGAISIWTRFDGTGNSVQASVRPPGGAWSDPEDLSTEGREAGLADLAFDLAGDAIALWGTEEGDDFVAQATGYDFVAPRLDNLLIPSTGKAGEPVGFAVSPFDVFPLGTTSWSFGDGGGASGDAVSHTYAGPGAYPVTVSVVDGGGNTSTRTTAIAIASTPPPPEPRLTALTLRIEKKSLRGLRRSGILNVTVSVDSAASAALNGWVKLPAQGKARPRLVPIFASRTVRFAAAGEQRAQLTLSGQGRKALQPLTKARVRVEAEASGAGGGTASGGAARTLRD